MSVGGFLGMGSEEHPIPWGKLTYDTRLGGSRTDITKSQFFLLSAGDRLLRAFVEILPRYSEKRQTLEIASEVEHHMTRYLLLVTVMNAIVGAATGLTMWAFGFEPQRSRWRRKRRL
jgi:hypothetical protein